MKAKLLPFLALLGLTVAILGISPFASAQTDISPAPSPLAQPTQSPEMQGMVKMSNSVTKMSEMCMAMMEKEKAMMPLIIGISAIFGLLLFVALLLLVVLEIQWIKYWSRILRQDVAARSP